MKNLINNQELKNDLIVSWNEIEEAITSINELTNDDLIKCKESILERLKNANYWLSKYVSEDDILQNI